MTKGIKNDAVEIRDFTPNPHNKLHFRLNVMVSLLFKYFLIIKAYSWKH